ncbi:uncharacterized protein [Choristoneura fumiferana]|uniref:uncharacterized protein n=1 Tax=Choristoneura fumiferana TaxID=7141 RepID=UPI003D15B6F7
MKEVLLNNLLDKEFQKMLFPLNLMQTVILQPKYRILNGFVTPIGLREYFICFLGVIVVIFVNLIKWYSSKFYYEVDLASVDTLLAFDTAFYSLSSFVLLTVNFVQSKNNVLLILKLQQVYKVFDSNSGLKKTRNYNCVAILIITLTCLLFLIINYGRHFHQIIFVISLYYFDGNIIFAIQIMKFLEHEIKMWLKALDRFCVTCSEPNHNKLTKYFSEIEQQETRLFTAFLDIMEAFKLYKYIFQYSVSIRAFYSLLVARDFIYAEFYY